MDFREQEEMLLICEVCDLPFTGIKPYEQHVKGKKHIKRAKDKERRMQVKSLDGNSHLEEAKDSDLQDYSCEVCRTVFTGGIPYTQHLKGRQHAKAVRKKKAEEDAAETEDAGSDIELSDNDDADLSEIVKKILPEPYESCSICEKQFSGIETYSQHLKGKSHTKRKSELQLLKKLKAVLSTCEDGDTEVSEERERERSSGDAEGQNELKCKVCEKIYVGAAPFAQHLTSKAHSKKENESKLLKQLEVIKMTELEEGSSSSEDEKLSKMLTCEVCSMVFSGLENLIAHIKSKSHQKAMKWKKFLTKKEDSIEDDGRNHGSLEKKDKTEKPYVEKVDSPGKLVSTSDFVKGDGETNSPAKTEKKNQLKKSAAAV